jgi:uncharacterized repeat protein (TIGR02543 family)
VEDATFTSPVAITGLRVNVYGSVNFGDGTNTITADNILVGSSAPVLQRLVININDGGTLDVFSAYLYNASIIAGSNSEITTRGEIVSDLAAAAAISLGEGSILNVSGGTISGAVEAAAVEVTGNGTQVNVSSSAGLIGSGGSAIDGGNYRDMHIVVDDSPMFNGNISMGGGGNHRLTVNGTPTLKGNISMGGGGNQLTVESGGQFSWYPQKSDYHVTMGDGNDTLTLNTKTPGFTIDHYVDGGGGTNTLDPSGTFQPDPADIGADKIYRNFGSSYTVTYDGNGSTGGSAPTDSGTYLENATVTVLGNTGSLVRTGYTFSGWNTASNGSGTDQAAGSTFTMGAANVTLYAKWIIDTPTPGPGPEPQPPMLLVSPAVQNAAKETGATTFLVENGGNGAVNWSAAVTSGSSWLTITSGTSGVNSGFITCGYTANTSVQPRTGIIRVTADGVAGSPVDVTVTQADSGVPILSVSPATQGVTKVAGTTTFSVSNAGTGTMKWVSQVSSGNTWLEITSGTSGTNSGTITCSYAALTGSTPRTGTVRITAAGVTGSPVDVTVVQTESSQISQIGSNSIDAIDMVKITDMSGTLPDAGGAVTVKAWDKNGTELSPVDYASPLFIYNHGTTSILGSDIEDRFPGGIPAAYGFSVESSKMFITHVNNSSDGEVKTPISYSNGISNFVSNAIGPRTAIKVTDMSGTIPSSGIAITVTAWDASGNAIPESASAAPLMLYSHATTTIAGSDLAARFPSGAPMTYEFTIASPKLVIANVKHRSDGTLRIPTVYTVGLSNFVSNSTGPNNTLYISDFSGTLGTDGADISIKVWDVSGKEIPDSASASAYKIFDYETVKITDEELEKRFSSSKPMGYDFTIGSSKFLITNVKSSMDDSINIPTVYTKGLTGYTTNYVSDLNIIQITDMSGVIPLTGASITIKARDMDGNLIQESTSAPALKLYNYGTTAIEGYDLMNRFPDEAPVSYEFTIGSTTAVVTNLVKSLDGSINIPTVFTIGPYGGI